MSVQSKAPTTSTVVTTALSEPVSVVTSSVSRHVVTTSKVKPSLAVSPSTLVEPLSLIFEDILQVSATFCFRESSMLHKISVLRVCHVCLPVNQPGRSGKSSVTADEEALTQIRKGHGTMCVMLTSRNKNLDTVRSLWAGGDIKVRLYYSSDIEYTQDHRSAICSDALLHVSVITRFRDVHERSVHRGGHPQYNQPQTVRIHLRPHTHTLV